MRQRRITEVAALRHVLQIKRRLQLEMLASISRLLREHEVNADDNLLASLVLAVPEELMDDNSSTLASRRLISNMAAVSKLRNPKPQMRLPKPPLKSPKPQPGDPDKAPRPQPVRSPRPQPVRSPRPQPVRSPKPQPPKDKAPKPQTVKPQTPKKKYPRPKPPKKNPRPQP